MRSALQNGGTSQPIVLGHCESHWHSPRSHRTPLATLAEESGRFGCHRARRRRRPRRCPAQNWNRKRASERSCSRSNVIIMSAACELSCERSRQQTQWPRSLDCERPVVAHLRDSEHNKVAAAAAADCIQGEAISSARERKIARERARSHTMARRCVVGGRLERERPAGRAARRRRRKMKDHTGSAHSQSRRSSLAHWLRAAT